MRLDRATIPVVGMSIPSQGAVESTLRAAGQPATAPGWESPGMRDTISRRIIASTVGAALIAAAGVASRGREPTAEPCLQTGQTLNLFTLAAPVRQLAATRHEAGGTPPAMPPLRPRTTGSLARMAAALPLSSTAPTRSPTKPPSHPAVLQPVDPEGVPSGAGTPGVGLPVTAGPVPAPRPAGAAADRPVSAPSGPGARARARVVVDSQLRPVQFTVPATVSPQRTDTLPAAAAAPVTAGPSPATAPTAAKGVGSAVESAPATAPSAAIDAPTTRRGPVATWLQGGRPARDPAPAGSAVADALQLPLAIGSRLRERIRLAERNLAERLTAIGAPTATPPAPSDGLPIEGGWPRPVSLDRQLEQLRDGAPAPIADWIDDTRRTLDLVATTAGPTDPLAMEPLGLLAEAPATGLRLADTAADHATAAQVRRAALAVGRRAAVWQAAATLRQSTVLPVGDAERCEAETGRLLDALERFETNQSPVDAHTASQALATLGTLAPDEPRRLATATRDHYAAANLRVAVHRQFVERLLPESEIDRGAVDDMILGRQVRGRRTVERTTGVRFVPDADELSFDLEVRGHVESRTVTESGPVALTSRGVSAFTVRKPVKLSAVGLLFGAASGVASNRSQLAGIETSFDSVPLMRSLVRTMAKNQHDEHLPEANREVVDKIVARACREVDQQAESQFVEMSQRIRGKVWAPLVKLGLEPTAVGMETTADLATVRLRLAAAGQLAAHTPRPRGPDDAMLAIQLHESSLNNAFDRLGLAGRRLALEDLFRLLAEKAGREAVFPEDLPEGVTVAFAASQPLRVSFRDGLVHLRLALDAIESGRRAWYDVIVQVAYRPRSGPTQVWLDREGPVQLSGPGHQGRIELALRTIFGKVFPKERPLPLFPAELAEHPKLVGMPVSHLAVTDGWLALALGAPPADKPATAAAIAPAPRDKPARRVLVR